MATTPIGEPSGSYFNFANIGSNELRASAWPPFLVKTPDEIRNGIGNRLRENDAARRAAFDSVNPVGIDPDNLPPGMVEVESPSGSRLNWEIRNIKFDGKEWAIDKPEQTDDEHAASFAALRLAQHRPLDRWRREYAHDRNQPTDPNYACEDNITKAPIHSRQFHSFGRSMEDRKFSNARLYNSPNDIDDAEQGSRAPSFARHSAFDSTLRAASADHPTIKFSYSPDVYAGVDAQDVLDAQDVEVPKLIVPVRLMPADWGEGDATSTGWDYNATPEFKGGFSDERSGKVTPNDGIVRSWVRSAPKRKRDHYEFAWSNGRQEYVATPLFSSHIGERKVCGFEPGVFVNPQRAGERLPSGGCVNGFWVPPTRPRPGLPKLCSWRDWPVQFKPQLVRWNPVPSLSAKVKMELLDRAVAVEKLRDEYDRWRENEWVQWIAGQDWPNRNWKKFAARCQGRGGKSWRGKRIVKDGIVAKLYGEAGQRRDWMLALKEAFKKEAIDEAIKMHQLWETAMKDARTWIQPEQQWWLADFDQWLNTRMLLKPRLRNKPRIAELVHGAEWLLQLVKVESYFGSVKSSLGDFSLYERKKLDEKFAPLPPLYCRLNDCIPGHEHNSAFSWFKTEANHDEETDKHNVAVLRKAAEAAEGRGAFEERDNFRLQADRIESGRHSQAIGNEAGKAASTIRDEISRGLADADLEIKRADPAQLEARLEAAVITSFPRCAAIRAKDCKYAGPEHSKGCRHHSADCECRAGVYALVKLPGKPERLYLLLDHLESDADILTAAVEDAIWAIYYPNRRRQGTLNPLEFVEKRQRTYNLFWHAPQIWFDHSGAKAVTKVQLPHYDDLDVGNLYSE